MTVRNKLSLITRVGATVAVATGLALAVQTPASAAPTVTVTPATGLSDGAKVTVTGSGLTPGTVYHVGQCAYVEPGKDGCDKTSAVDVTADAQGKVNTQLTVHATFEAVVGSDGTPWGTVDCKATACRVGLGSAAGDGGGQEISFS